ncbi:hypothetical protein [Leucobacter luti]|nr:hypothetical protein [Leucobacter luti]
MMDDKQFRERVALPTLDTRRADGISDTEIAWLLDAGSVVVSSRYPDLGQKMRRELFEAIDQPSEQAWDAIFDLPVKRPGDEHPAQLMWSLVLAYTSYDVCHHHRDDAWPSWPSGAQLVLALSSYLGPANPDPHELF